MNKNKKTILNKFSALWVIGNITIAYLAYFHMIITGSGYIWFALYSVFGLTLQLPCIYAGVKDCFKKN